MTTKKGLLVILSLILAVMAFGDYIFLVDGSKLEGTILSFGERFVDILLDNGYLVTVNKNEIVRLEPLDSARKGGALMSELPPQLVSGASIGSAGVGTPVGVFGAEVPVFLGDPELEIRKRMLMYRDKMKDTWVATQMSLFFPSAGHLYTGEWERGFLFLGARAVFGGLAIWGFIPVPQVDPTTGDFVVDQNDNPINQPQNMMIGAIGAGGFALFTILEAIDAYNSAERYNQQLRIRLGIEPFDPFMFHAFGR